MPEFKNKVELENVTAIRQPDLSVLCEIDGKEIWIPQSQIDDDSEVWEEGDSGTLVISEWLATQKGLV